MSTGEHLIYDLFYKLNEDEKVKLLRDAEIPDNRPSILKDDGGYHSDGAEWLLRHKKLVVPLLLRVNNLSNYEIRQIASEGDFSVKSALNQREVTLHIRLQTLPKTDEEQNDNDQGRVRLTELAAASAMMSELFIIIGGANMAISRETPFTSPAVTVRGGSIEFTLGGSLFASGIGLIVACSAGLIAAPIVGAVAGAALASVGIIELALDWKKRIAETQKTEEETRILKFEHDIVYIQQSKRLQALEIKKKELELQMAHISQQESEREIAYSNLIPRKVVLAQVEYWGVSEEYANHILNKALPTYIALRQYFAEIEAKQKRVG